MTQPNILFVFTDQQTLSAMSCAGNPWVLTPGMDRLAAEGVRFTRSYCTAPVCGPSRTSQVTGLMPHTHRLVYNDDRHFRDTDSDRLPTVADFLRKAGYAPYWIGKWHARDFYPNRRERIHGFDFLPVEFEGSVELGVNMDSPVTRRAVEFLENPPTQPFFLGVSWHNPHDICYWIMEQYRDRLDPFTDQGELPPLPPNFAISQDEPEFFKICRTRSQYGPEIQHTKSWNETMWRKYLRAYHRLTETADAELGRVIQALDRGALAENTLVVFTSDHGEGCAGHQFVVKLTPYEEATAVPLIARLPGVISAGKTCATHIASGLDLTPTFCDYAGAIASGNLPGMSLRPMLENPEVPGRDFVVVNVEPDPQQPELAARMVRTPSYKYMAFSLGEPREALYHMVNDPGETRNVASDPAYRVELDRHRVLLREWQLRVADPFPQP